MKKLIFIFIDGVGIGKADAGNPFFAADTDYMPFFEGGCKLPDRTPVKAIDACLGVEGMPMSATGQTSLFTGVNVPAQLAEHRDSYPDSLMRKIIKEKSIFTLLRKKKLIPRFLNAFPGSSDLYTPFHVHIRDDGEFRFSGEFRSRVKRSLSVTTCMMIANHMMPFGNNDIRNERALFHDFTNLSLNGSGANLPQFSPEKAAEIIYKVSRKYDLLLYEYFQTDFYGHGFEMTDCIKLVQQLDRLIKHLVHLLDKKKDTLLVTSDHGNLEDGNTHYHTYNPVPLITWGLSSGELRDRIDNLTDVTPAIVKLFNSR
jgi:predicted AlkP superfamily pyrophosphatase or phosphodiesterase